MKLLHICESKCFIWQGGLWSTASPYEAILRIMKHACRRMKRSLDRLHVFLPWNQGKKNGVNDELCNLVRLVRELKFLSFREKLLHKRLYLPLSSKTMQLIVSIPCVVITVWLLPVVYLAEVAANTFHHSTLPLEGIALFFYTYYSCYSIILP